MFVGVFFSIGNLNQTIYDSLQRFFLFQSTVLGKLTGKFEFVQQIPNPENKESVKH